MDFFVVARGIGICGFYKFMGVLEGLKLAKVRGFKIIEINVDTQSVLLAIVGVLLGVSHVELLCIKLES